MNYEIEKQLVKQAVRNCLTNVDIVDFPIGDFADDMAHALSVINSLLDKVKELEARINAM